MNKLNEQRLQQIRKSYDIMQPFIREIARGVRQGKNMLDVGSGEGIIALAMADDFGAAKVFLTDREHSPAVPLPSNAEFHHIDALSSAFVERFKNKVSLVTCIRTFHEFEDPMYGLQQLLSVLPAHGMLLLMECTEEGWEHQWELCRHEGAEARRHFIDDLTRACANRLDTDHSIRDFWERRCFPGIPGECHLMFNGDLYTVMYMARQWYEVKEPPDWMRKQVDDYLRSQPKKLEE